MKKFILLVLVIVMLLPCFTSCDPVETNGDIVELTFLKIDNNQVEADYWKDFIKRFEAKYDNIKVTFDDAAIGEAMDTTLTSMFNGNSGPDIIGHGIISVASRVEAGHYIPITDYFNNWDGKDDIMQSVLANGTYKDEVYGLAYSTTPFVFAYRKDLFAKAGLPDKAPETWEQLAEYAEKLTEKENGRVTTAGFAFPTSAGNFVEFDCFTFTNGGRYYNEAGDIMLNTQDKVEAFEFLKTIVNDYSLPYNSGENIFLQGSAAMTLINNVPLTKMLDDPEYKDKIGIALPPSNKEKATFSGCNMLFMGRDCKNPDEVFKFMEMALSEEEVLKRAEVLNVPVVRKSLVDQFAALDPYNAVRAECVANGIGMPRTTWASIFQRIRNEMVEKILYDGADIQATLNAAQAELEAEVKK